MASSSGNSLLNSLRGKIWISTSVLAFFICTFGLISYLVVTLLTNNPFYGVFIPFLFLAFSVIVFGWWLSNELVTPIDRVTLLAKSLERNSSTSIPKSSGSSETDQLLQTLHRNSVQMQNVVSLMDKVAGGNLDVALKPIEGSDRLSASFQRLLSKVSESIHAKEDLDKLEREIERLKRDLTGIRSGKLDVEIASDGIKTKELADTYEYLIEKLSLLISLIKVDSTHAKGSADEVESTIESLIAQDENTIQKMNNASVTLKQVPNLIEKISEDLMRSANSAKQTIDKTRHGTKISQDNSESVSQLRSKLRESINRMQNLNERSLDIAKVAKTVEDLANRTNMIALNASIQATEFGEDGRGFVLISEELERLATRANGTNKQISMLNNSIIAEIVKVEDSLDTTMGEVAGLSKFAIETSNILGELERYVGKFLNLQENLIAFSQDKSEETDEAFETFVATISESEDTIKDLRNSSAKVKNIGLLMKNLTNHTAEFRVFTEPEADEEIQEPSEYPENIELEPSHQDESETKDKVFSTEAFNNAKLDSAEIRNMTWDADDGKFESADSENNVAEAFDSQELNSDDFDSRDFDSGELYAEEMQSIQNSLEEVTNVETQNEQRIDEKSVTDNETDELIEKEVKTSDDEVIEISPDEKSENPSMPDLDEGELLNLVNDPPANRESNLEA